MKTKLPLSRKVQLAFGSAILVLLVVGAVSYGGMIASAESERWVRHTHEVLEELQDLGLSTQSIQSSGRGFVLTGDESYAKSYLRSVSSAQEADATLRFLTIDNSAQRGRILSLEALLAQKIENTDMVMGLRRDKGLEAAAAAIKNGSGQRVMDDLEEVIRQMRQEELRLLILRDADAKRHWLRTKFVLILGTVLGLLIAGTAGWSVHRNLEVQQLGEQALRESAERFSDLANNISQLAWMADEKGRIFWYNQRWFDYSGTTLEEMEGWGWKKIHHPDHVARVVEKITRCFQTGEVWDDTFPLRGKDGKYRWFLSRAIPIRDAEGKVSRWFGTNTDISERREAERYLAQTEDRYRGLLEAAPDAMVVVNPGGEIVLLNVQAEKQFGYRRDELLGQQIKNIIPEGFAERLIADALRSSADALAQQIGTGIELMGRRKDGTEFPIEIMLSPLKSADGILVTAAIRDITIRKKGEVNLLRKVEELKRSNEELGQFAYIASHDLQEPLRMVASYTQLLAVRYKGRLDNDADSFINFAVDGANRMQRLIQDLLEFSRVGTQGEELLDTSSEAALQYALVNLRGAILEKAALVTHDPLPAVLADKTQLTQLFQNLIGNGIKYQKTSGVPQVHISATRKGGNQWTFSVKDNGLGIEAQYFDKIFGMFQRLHKREEFEGTGIGLAICKKIVERHGGQISVESQPGEGSTFHFALAASAGKS